MGNKHGKSDGRDNMVDCLPRRRSRGFATARSLFNVRKLMEDISIRYHRCTYLINRLLWPLVSEREMENNFVRLNNGGSPTEAGCYKQCNPPISFPNDQVGTESTIHCSSGW